MSIFDKAWGWLSGSVEKRSVTFSPQLLEAMMADDMMGGRVRGYRAMQCTALLTGLRVLSETALQLVPKVYYINPANPDVRNEAREHPLWRLLTVAANPEMPACEWRERAILDAVVWGDHFSQLMLDSRGNVREMWPLEGGRMYVDRDSSGRLAFDYQRGNGSPRQFTQDELFRMPIMSDGIRGRSLVELAAKAIGLSIEAQEFARLFFTQGDGGRWTFEFPESLDIEKVKAWEQHLHERYGGRLAAHKIRTVGGGVKVRYDQVDVQKLMLMEVRKFQLEEVARVLRIPLHMMQSLDRSTNNNIEHQGIEFAMYTATPWFKRIEQRMAMHLFGPGEARTHYVEFDVDGLIRGDLKSRNEALSMLVKGSIMQPNEARKRLNLPPDPDGGRLLMQAGVNSLTKEIDDANGGPPASTD